MTRRSVSAGLTSRMIRAVGDKIAPSGKGEGRLCVLNYHRILESRDPFLDSEPDIETFHWQMESLADCFNVMPLQEALDRLRTERMPPRAVSITFDDGYRSVHDLALPILGKFGLPATVFITSGCIDGDDMWNDRIIEAVKRLPPGHLDLREMGLGIHSLHRTEERKLAAVELNKISKYLPAKARDGLTAKLQELVGAKLGRELMLTREMISTLVRKGIEIGAHTVTHPILSKLEDCDARSEIVASKRELEALTGKEVHFFAYPNGKPVVDFDERHAEMVRSAGFSAAFTTSMGSVASKQDRFHLPRSRPWDSTPARFSLRLLHWLRPRP